MLAEALAFGAVWFAAPVYWPAAEAEALVAAAAICLIAALAAMVPVAWANARSPKLLNEAGLAAMGLRMFLTLGAGGAYWAMADPPKSFYLKSMAAWYLALLAVETGVIVFVTRRHWGATPPRSREGQSSE